MNSIEDAVLSAVEQIVQKSRPYYTVQDVLRKTGYSLSFVRHNRWTMPNFGRSDFPGRTKKWRPDTFNEWYSVPLYVRQEQLHTGGKR